MANEVIFRPPAPAISIIGWESDATISGSVSLNLPTPVLGTGSIVGAQLTLPVPTLAVTGFSGIVTTAFQTPLAIPVSSLAIAGTQGAIGSVILALPAPALAAGGPTNANLVLPKPQIGIAGAVGSIGSVKLQQPVSQLAVVGSEPFAAQTSLSITPTLAIAGVVGAKGSVGLSLQRVALAAAGYTGVVGSATLQLPVVKLGVVGYPQAVGSVALTVPVLLLQATGRTANAGTSTAFAINLEGQALTQYTNYAFNSMTKFNGVYLGANDSGIYALAGADDAGVAIDAVARVGITDFGTALLKRIVRAYVGYKAGGELELRVITDETNVRRYRLASSGVAGLHGGRVKVGMGIEARYWQFEIANVGGADFTLNCLEVTPSRMGRRVRDGET